MTERTPFSFSIDFLKYRPWYLLFSTLIFSTLIGTLIYKHYTYGRTFSYSVDFTGGTQALIGFSKPVTAEHVAGILANNAIAGATVRDFSENEVMIRLKPSQDDAQGVGLKIKNALEKSLKETTVEIKQIEHVGSSVGESLRWQAIQAIIIGLLCMMLYTWWRFWSLSFGAGVLISLFHDAIVILAFFLLLNLEISIDVIGAILAILGYSINDTIVIFARIRENMKTLKNVSMEKIVNISINETLRRTLLTSFATALVVVSLLIFGGERLRTLSLALLIGIVFGTYSSIAIASPIMLLLHKNK